MSNEITETKKEIKRYKEMLKDPACDFTTQTWIELQLKEFRKYIKYLKRTETPTKTK